MNIKQNAGGPPPGAGTSRANFLQTMLKRAAVHLYCHGVITSETLARVFERFDLRSA